MEVDALMTNRSDLDQIAKLEQEARMIAQGLVNLDAGGIVTQVTISVTALSVVMPLGSPGLTIVPPTPVPMTTPMPVTVPAVITDPAVLAELRTALIARQDEITQQLAELGVV
jgi:hypothetical protein